MLYFQNCKSKAQDGRPIDFQEVIERITSADLWPSIDKADDKTSFVPVIQPSGSKTSGWEGSTDLIAVDIDGGLDMDTAKERLTEQNLQHHGYTTASHTEDNHRYRVVLPLSEPVEDSQTYLATMSYLNDTVFSGAIDPAYLTNPNQGSLLPCIVNETEPTVFEGSGVPVIPVAPTSAPETTSLVDLVDLDGTTLPENDLRSYLNHCTVDGGDYDSWIKTTIRVVASIQQGFIEEAKAFTIWDDWCQGFDGYDEVANLKKWDSELGKPHDPGKAIQPFDDEEPDEPLSDSTHKDEPALRGSLTPPDAFWWNKEFQYVEPLVSNLLQPDESMMIFSESGQGKSWVAMALAVLLATGDKRTAWAVRDPKKVLYIEDEMSEQATIMRFRKLVAASDRALVEANLFPKSTAEEGNNHLNLCDKRDLQYLLDYCEKWKFEVVILDNLSTMFQSAHSENDKAYGDQVTHALRKLKEIGVQPIFIHHTGKNKEGGPRGSSSLEQNCGTVMRIKKADGFNKDTYRVWDYKLKKNREGFFDRGAISTADYGDGYEINVELSDSKTAEPRKPGRPANVTWDTIPKEAVELLDGAETTSAHIPQVIR